VIVVGLSGALWRCLPQAVLRLRVVNQCVKAVLHVDVFCFKGISKRVQPIMEGLVDRRFTKFNTIDTIKHNLLPILGVAARGRRVGNGATFM
jgi:hypothetical protein